MKSAQQLVGAAKLPAFPHTNETLCGLEGLSILQYFATRAPHEIPAWFRPATAKPEPDQPEYPTLDTERAKRLCSNWITDPCYDLAPAGRELFDLGEITADDVQALEMFEIAHLAWSDTRVEWDAEYARQRVAQWPWTWAALVLAAEPEATSL